MAQRTEASMRLSVIIPMLNEADCIAATLAGLEHMRVAGHEVIVVDGGSHDASIALAQPLADVVTTSPSGRARQMNAGARLARGDVLLFLHADTQLPRGAERMILDGLHATGLGWGRFDVRLTGMHPLMRIIEGLMNIRSRLTGIATGDQAIFVRRDWFEAMNGYPDMALMEDIALSRNLKRKGRPLCLRARVVTSSRRWEKYGIVRTVLSMWLLRFLFFIGADPARLATYYRRT